MNKKFLIALLLLIPIFAVIVIAASSQRSPSACNGQWSLCSYANSNDLNRASTYVNATFNKSSRWYNYYFSTGNGAIIENVSVRADFFASRTNGYLNVRVSGDGGLTWGQNHIVGGNTLEQTYNIDVTNDLTWTPSKLSNANFRVNATCFKQGSGPNPTCNLDWIPVTVTYTPFNYTLSSNPLEAIVTQGDNSTTTVTASLISGNTQNVFLWTNNCPTNAICTFNSSNGYPTFNSDFKVQTYSDQNGTLNMTPVGNYNIVIWGYGDGVSKNTNFNLTVV
ncbi:hypothetical protein HYW75_01160 [Candidatus Pacearchaeota archaeon]|nr:hypothetical protein [Candidatus Pacearchaeota archaeon]